MKIRAELTLRDTGHVRADTSALLRLTFSVDAAALDGAFSGNCTDSGHGGLDWLKVEVKGSSVGRSKLKLVRRATEFYFSHLWSPKCVQHLEFLAKMGRMQELH